MKKLLLTLLSTSFIVFTNAQTGSLDSAFGNNGIQLFSPDLNVTASVLKVLVAPDKSFYVVYSAADDALIVVAKYFPDGTPDASYGNAGYSDILPMNFSDATLQSSGRIIIAGSSRQDYSSVIHDDLLVYRLTNIGFIDQSFNGSGFVTKTYTATSYEFTTSVTVADNLLVVTGFSESLVGNIAYHHVDVYDTSGVFLGNFFIGDIADAGTFDPSDFPYSIAIQDQKIVVATYDFKLPPNERFSLLRFNAGGSPDNTFDLDGIDTIGKSFFFGAPAVAIQGNKIVVASAYNDLVTGTNGFAIARYKDDGALDSSFNGTGMQTTDFGTATITPRAIAIQGNKIIVGGNFINPATQKYELALVRYNNDGALDNSFDGDGKQTTGVSGYNLSMDKMNVYGNRLFVSGRDMAAAYILEGKVINFACPNDKTVFTDIGVCTAVVKDIAPFGDPSPNDLFVEYNLSGATTGTGIGDASGQIFNKGITTVIYSLIDDPATTCTFNVIVKDGEAPLITNAFATPGNLWPPNHQLRDLSINYAMKDNCNDAVVTLFVRSNEPQTGTGRSDLPNDWQVMSPDRVRLRAERNELGSGRIYTITITAKDAAGNVTRQDVIVTVPLSQGLPKLYTSNRGENLSVKVLSNPSENYFTLQTSSNNNKPLVLRVTNAVGSVMETQSGVPANGQMQVGRNYSEGFYFAELIQGGQKVVVKLIKMH
ncbi:MAG: T9SS type A sorting domain-containing protein [Ferruginibacter sp.]